MPANYSLGGNEFIRFAREGGGPPALPTQLCELIRRPGANGTGLLLFGVQGEPFTMVSGIDPANESEAWDIYYDYHALRGGDAVELVWAGRNLYDEYDVKYWVQNVEVGRLIRLGASTRGDYWLEARWTLCPVVIDD